MEVLSATEIEARLDYPSLIETLRAAFRAGGTAPLRHRHEIPTPSGRAAMLLKPAWRRGGPFAVKVINIFPDNAERRLPAVQGTVMLFDGDTGAPLAVLDGGALTIRRTAAASALAADYLARRDAGELALVGTGQLAPALALAHAAIRPIERVVVWGRTASKADRLAQSLCREGLSARSTTDLEAAVRGADIVSTATLAAEPLVMGEWLRPGAHLDLVGSFTPEMREADDEAMRRGRIYVDTREGALAESGDLIQPIAGGAIAAGDIVGELSELCRGTVAGRRTEGEITVFKSVGTALEDLAAAELAVERGPGGATA